MSIYIIVHQNNLIQIIYKCTILSISLITNELTIYPVRYLLTMEKFTSDQYYNSLQFFWEWFISSWHGLLMIYPIEYNWPFAYSWLLLVFFWVNFFGFLQNFGGNFGWYPCTIDPRVKVGHDNHYKHEPVPERIFRNRFHNNPPSSHS